MTYYSLFFEARGIQAYIFDSGKMKEMVGASELVKNLCGDNLDSVIKHLNLEEIKPTCKVDSAKLLSLKENEIFFSRRCGGVFTALFADKNVRDRFLEIWSLMVSSKVPGLEFVNAVSEGEDIAVLIKDSYDKLAQNRNNPMVMIPEATSMHILAPRTGKPAIKNEHEAGNKKVWLDEASVSKRKLSSNVLSDSFLSDNSKYFNFPSNLEYDDEGKCDFPFLSGSRYLGLIHADGNGLGQALIKIRNEYKNGAEYATMLRLFSDSLEEATRAAAQEATNKLISRLSEKEVEKKYLPMRPLVLGGDDLTVFVRADLAMQFTEDYCNAFESCTEECFAELHKESNGVIPKKLTACAGLAYVKNNQPFMDAFNLTESLCSASKKVSKDIDKENVPASVTSMIVSNSFIEDYETYKKKELTIKKGNKTLVATMGTFALNGDGLKQDKEKKINLYPLSLLRKLCNAFNPKEENQKEAKNENKMVSSANVRQYATMIFGDLNISGEKWRRWVEVLNSKKKGKEIFDCLKEFGVEKPEEDPWTKDNRTPVFDAIQLMEMEEK